MLPPQYSDTAHNSWCSYITHVWKTFCGVLFYFNITGMYWTDPQNNKLDYRQICFQGLPWYPHLPMFLIHNFGTIMEEICLHFYCLIPFYHNQSLLQFTNITDLYKDITTVESWWWRAHPEDDLVGIKTQIGTLLNQWILCSDGISESS